jgi:hypothetical protein
MKIKEGKTELTVQHNGKDLTFQYPNFNGDYFQLQEQIEKANLKCPNFGQTTSLVHNAFNSNDKYSEEIKQIMKDAWFYAFTGNLYIPNKGVYIQDNPKIKEGNIFMEESELVKKLEKNDSSVRFVPFGFKTKTMSALELAKNPYVIGLTGSEENADKLAQIADKHKIIPHLWSFKKVDEKLARVSKLDAYSNFVDRLFVYGDNRGGNSSSYAFGVQE